MKKKQKIKIITWNINGYRSITGQNPSTKYGKVSKENKLFDYIKDESPDIICLQETKAGIEQIDEELRAPKGYHSYFHSCSLKKGYSGVATICKVEPTKINYKIGIEEFDSEGRIVETHFKEFILLNIYFPKGYANSDRLDYKLEFYDAIFAHLKKLTKVNKNIIISGDFNTAHHPIDLARPEQNLITSGFMPVEREKLDELVKKGYVDAFREIEKEAGHYTWWSQRGRSRENNIGWRIDYHFISQSLLPHLSKASIQPLVEGSDHCPAIIELSF